MIAVMILLAFIGGYVVSSLILLRFPTLVHKKKKLKFCARHISHRGGAAECLENTIAAFKHAQSLGTQMFELDCQMTRDGQVVVSHDDTLIRACHCDLRISETNYEDLPSLNPRLKVEFMPNVFAEGEDRKIPLLEVVFQQFPHMPVNIDIKTNNDDLMEKVNELVQKYQREEITAWGNRSDEVCQKLYRINPKVPMIFSLKQVVLLMVYFWTGLLPFIPIKESLLEVVMPSILFHPDSIIGSNLSSSLKAFLKVMDAMLMRPALIKHLERRGIQTYLWVLNTEHDFQRAFKLGAAGIMTDQVTLLKEYLDDNHKTWHSNSNGPLNSYHSLDDIGGVGETEHTDKTLVRLEEGEISQ